MASLPINWQSPRPLTSPPPLGQDRLFPTTSASETPPAAVAGEPDKRPKKFYAEKQLCPSAAGMSRDKTQWMESSCNPPNLLPHRRQVRTNSPVPGSAPRPGGQTARIPLRRRPESLRCACRGGDDKLQKKQRSGKIRGEQDGSLNPEHRILPLRRAETSGKRGLLGQAARGERVSGLLGEAVMRTGSSGDRFLPSRKTRHSFPCSARKVRVAGVQSHLREL